ncbi:TIM barrel protein [Paeniglutamicibacter antarcticus]|uniref:TIM barrel protein n=2 Tax=Arthrobacter terrae TaxID=2935737 RepID=A0A931GCB9_9MICC|nr:TIM barrel protein [Arthrobacter terrae]
MTGTPRRHVPQVAANPIPYWSRGGSVDKSKGVFEQAFKDFQRIGFTAVKADVPEGMSAGDYSEWIGGYGLSPSLSLFNSAFDETIRIGDEVERAKTFAADQLALGLDRTMISSMSLPARLAKPAVGADFSEDRLQLAIENVGTVCRTLQSEGLRPLHHSHIGGVFETEDEITRLLDTLGKDIIGFGPDTGHLRWAGIDPVAMIGRYADRIGGIHLKDVFADYLDPQSREGMGYFEVSATKRLWAEPGLGVLDLPAVIAAMPEDYDGDYMIEVDQPSVDSLFESHRMSYEWARQTLDSRLTPGRS